MATRVPASFLHKRMVQHSRWFHCRSISISWSLNRHWVPWFFRRVVITTRECTFSKTQRHEVHAQWCTCSLEHDCARILPCQISRQVDRKWWFHSLVGTITWFKSYRFLSVKPPKIGHLWSGRWHRGGTTSTNSGCLSSSWSIWASAAVFIASMPGMYWSWGETWHKTFAVMHSMMYLL